MNFNFQSIAHVFATVAADIVKAGKVVQAIISKVQAAEPEIEALTGVIASAYPQAAVALPIERASFAALGMIAHAVNSAGDVANAQGLNVQLDADFVKEIQALLPALKAQAATAGVKL